MDIGLVAEPIATKDPKYLFTVFLFIVTLEHGVLGEFASSHFALIVCLKIQESNTRISLEEMKNGDFFP